MKNMERELKIFDTSNNVQTDTSGNWDNGYLDPVGGSFRLCLFYPKQGYKIDEYIGNAVAVHKLEIRMGLCMPLGFTTDPNIPQSIFTRMVLFCDKQTNFARIDGSEVFDGTGSTSNVVTQDYDVDTIRRIDILWDKMFCHNIESITGLVQVPPIPISFAFPSKYISEHIVINFPKPIIVKFAPIAAIANVTSILNNSFHLIAQSTDTPNIVSPKGISVVYNCRTYFTDV